MIDGCKMKCPFGMGPFLGDMLIYWHIFTAPIVFGDDASWKDDPMIRSPRTTRWAPTTLLLIHRVVTPTNGLKWVAGVRVTGRGPHLVEGQPLTHWIMPSSHAIHMSSKRDPTLHDLPIHVP